MRQLLITLSILCALLGLALTILPFGSIALIPLIAAFIFGLLAFKATQKANKNTGIIKAVFLVTIVALTISIYRSVFETNVIEDDIETIEKEKQEEEETMNELEDLDIEE